MKSTTNNYSQSIFIDSSAWISFLIPSDTNYSRSSGIFQKFNKKTQIYTSFFIIDEVITKIRRSLNQKEVDKFFMKLSTLEKNNSVRILPIDKIIVKKAVNLLHKNPTPNTFSLTDATNMILVEKYNVKALFTFDNDFNRFKSPKLIILN